MQKYLQQRDFCPLFRHHLNVDQLVDLNLHNLELFLLAIIFMPLRPFPLPSSIGTDIIHVKRIYDILSRSRGKAHHSQRFLRRFLTPGEVQEFQKRFGEPASADGAQLRVISKHLAGRYSAQSHLSTQMNAEPGCRWAAKEAAIKAVTWRRLSFHDVIIQRIEDQVRVQAVILDNTSRLPRAQGEPSAGLEGQIAKISISHDGDYATAVCLAAEVSAFEDPA